MKPVKGTYPDYYDNYIPLVKENSVLEALKNNGAHITQLMSQLPAERENYAYAPGKWTVKQVLCHLSDTEQICIQSASLCKKGHFCAFVI